MTPANPALSLGLCSVWVGFAVGGEAAAAPGRRVEQRVIERGPHERVIETTRLVTDANGKEKIRCGRYTEVRNGVHYLVNGDWVETVEVIEAYPGGAAALRGPYQVIFPHHLASADGVDLLTPDAKRLRFRVLGLAWQDRPTGRRVWLGQTRPCVGVIVPPNQVIYEDAFEGVEADVRYTYTSGAFEQDVILREPLRVPEGMDSRSGLVQAVTEFFDPPAAEVQTHGRERSGTSDAESEAMNGMADAWIGFGAMQITRGRAFSLDGAAERGPKDSVPVSKRWETAPRRGLLFESVEYDTVADALERLRPDHARTKTRERGERAGPSAAVAAPAAPMAPVASLRSRPGFVLDFIVVYSAPNYSFQTDQTYRISSAVWISSSATFQPGAILKFTTLPTPGSLTVSGSLGSPGTVLPRCTFTHVDDNSIGEPIGSGNPQDKYPCALNLYDPSGYAYPPTIQRLEFRYGATGVQVYWPGPYSPVTVQNCIWRHCNVGVSAYYSRVRLSQLFMCEVTTQTLNLGGGSSFEWMNPILTDCDTGNAAPVITVEPVNRAANVGGTAAFTVTATGYGLTYQWYFNNASIGGATGATYTRTAIQHAHAGQYRVVVANDVGQVKSAVATLTVTGPPQITVQPLRQTLPEDSVTTFSVGAVGNGPFTYQWYQDSTPLVNGGRISGATSFELRFSKCLSTDSGRDHWVRVSNAQGGTDSATARLTVTSGCQDRTYTSTTDFTGHGILINLNAGTAGEIRLNTTPKPLPFVNMALSGRGSVCRIDANSGAVIGEYFTAPAPIPEPGSRRASRSPSRTTVDRFGSVWVGNRGGDNPLEDTTACFGLAVGGIRGRKNNGQFEPDASGEYLKPPFTYNTCPDRDGDGLIRTSSGRPLDWLETEEALDEARLHYVHTGVSSPRALAVDRNNDVWVGGWGDQNFVKLNGITGIPDQASRFNLGKGGYGALVDGNGILWSAHQLDKSLLRYAGPSCTEATCLRSHGEFGDYGLAIDPQSQDIWHGHRYYGYASRISGSLDEFVGKNMGTIR